MIHTKCGGPNPVGYYPHVDQLVLFSQEDQDFFRADPRFQGTESHLIPNRVGPVAQNEAGISKLRAGIPPGDLVFLRIARVAQLHEDSILQTLELVRRLRSDRVPARFLHIGVVNDSSSLARLQGKLGAEDRMLTEPGLTRQASALIEAGEFVVGTGRSFMEAASRSRVMLAPVAGSPFPVLATPNRFRELRQANFSSRSRIAGLDPEMAYQEIRRATESPEERRKLGAFSREMFDRHFSIEKAVSRYLRLYEHLAPVTATRWLDVARHALKVIRWAHLNSAHRLAAGER
ncbi:MAG: hypothetical protein H6827_00100 [Planctomycetes bacterium]|nr:hypothetical protein [Planctomycetota bacterium]